MYIYIYIYIYLDTNLQANAIVRPLYPLTPARTRKRF